MTIDTHGKITTRRAGGDGARAVIAVGGLLAAFGVASCCALPIGLSMLGISAASLVGIGFAAAAYQRELFWIASLCLAAVAVLSWRRWQAATRDSCAVPRTRFQTLVGIVTLTSVVSAAALIALTFWIEGPV
jgi:mercuric ion transport protein